MSGAVIQIDQVKKAYPTAGGQTLWALDGVSFQVAEGSICGLLGANGAGKSTLVKVVTTLTAPTAGRAAVRGHDVVRQPLEVRRALAVVLQQTAVESLLSVEDNLLIYAQLHGVGRAEARARARSVVEEFELGDKIREKVQDLSIGTKRRVQVAKIFMLEAPVIVLDEATTGMDPLMKRRVLDRLRAEAGRGRTVLLTTQILSEAEQICDTIIIIHKGRTLASGTLHDLRKLSQQLLRVSLTFRDGPGPAAVTSRLEALHPRQMKVLGSTVELTVEGEEAALLGELAEISRTSPIAQFEVRGPDLEEIFVTLLAGAR
jgi:ABC-2 type transport system ATP-binding protein